MANPTAQVKVETRDYSNPFIKYPLDPAVATTYYPGELIGRKANGYAGKFDDTSSMEFLGAFMGPQWTVATTDPTPFLARIEQAKTYTIPLQTGTASRLASGTGGGAIGKLCYASYSNTATIDGTALTYANVIGRIVDIGPNLSTPLPGGLTSTLAVVVEPVPLRSCGERTVAAAANTTISLFDMGKLIIVPNTANVTLSLPPVALTTPGDTITFFKSTVGGSTLITTLAGNDAELIGAANTDTQMDAIYDTITLKSLGTKWGIVAKVIA